MLSQEEFIGLKFEKCRIERLIGRGGYGLTFLAFDEELLEDRVIKICQTPLNAGADTESRLKPFIDEGLILSRLKHPQIVTLRAQGELYRHRYMLLDYIHGHSFKAILDAVSNRSRELGCPWGDLLDPPTASALILSSLYPLAYAHSANIHLHDREIFGVAHRDVAPGNLILGAKGNEKNKVILIDFGTAKTSLQESVTVNQNLVGTVPYMSKARLQKATASDRNSKHQEFWQSFRETRHDVHSMGVLYYQMLTGDLLFSGDTTPQVIVQILDPENYFQCYETIKTLHEPVGSIIRKSIIYYDFEKSLDNQDYQFPDALAMLQAMEKMYSQAFGEIDYRTRLERLNAKLADLQTLIPTTGPRRMAAHLTQELPPATPSTHPVQDFQGKLVDSTQSRFSGIGALGLLLISVVGGAYWLLHSQRPAKPVMALDRLESLANDSALPPSRLSEKPVARPGGHSNRQAPVVAHTEKPQAKPEKGDEPRPLDEATLVPDIRESTLPRERFIEAQTLVRTGKADALGRVESLLGEYPDSPDLLFLSCKIMEKVEPPPPKLRTALVQLQQAAPSHLHPQVFQENILFMLWQVDSRRFEITGQASDKIDMIKSGHKYLAKYRENPRFQEKSRLIEQKLHN